MVKLSTVIELLLLCLLIAFAASRVIDPIEGARGIANDHHHGHHKISFRKNRQEVDVPNRFCKCSSLSCNCCRDFSLPVVPIKGPGCAMIRYLSEDKISITMSFGDRVLRNITVNGKTPKPVCMGLPGGISKFCGKVYGINRDGDQFKACLGLELRALDDVEAALRVSCFRFGPEGLNLEPGQPVPVDEEDEDDDDDEYGLDDDDDDDDDDDFGLDDDDDDDEEAVANDADNDVDSDESDYTGFSALSEEFLGDFFGSESSKKKKPVIKRKDPVQIVQPVVAVNSVQKPVKVQNVKPVKTGSTQATRKPIRKPTTPTASVVKRPAAATVQTATKPNPVKEEPVTATAITITVEQGGQKIEESKKPQVVLQNKDVKPVKPQENKPAVTSSVKPQESKPAVVSSVKLQEDKPAVVSSVKLQEDKPAVVSSIRPIAMTKPVVKVEQVNKEPSKVQENMNDQTVTKPIIKTDSSDKINSEKVGSVPEKQSAMNDNNQSQSMDTLNTTAPMESSNLEILQPAESQQTLKEKNQLKVNAVSEVDQDQITTEQSSSGITSVTEEGVTDEENKTDTENSEPATEPSLSEEGSDKVEAITENSNTNKDDTSYEEDEEDNDDDIGVSILDDDEEEEEEDISKQDGNKSGLTKEEIIPEIVQPEKKEAEDEEEDDDLLGGILDDDDDDENEEEERKIEAPVQINPLLYQLASISVGNTPQARHLPPLSPFYRSSRTHKRMRLPPIESTVPVS